MAWVWCPSAARGPPEPLVSPAHQRWPREGRGSADGITICPAGARSGGESAGLVRPPASGLLRHREHNHLSSSFLVPAGGLASLFLRGVGCVLRSRCLARDWAALSCPVISRRKYGWDRMDLWDGGEGAGVVLPMASRVADWICRWGGGVGWGVLFCWRGNDVVRGECGAGCWLCRRGIGRSGVVLAGD